MAPADVVDATDFAEVLTLLEEFRGVFRRADQADRAAAYLRGLLRAGGRRTIGEIARQEAGGSPDTLAQALQHFLNRSPWDEEDLLRLHRRRQAPWRQGGVLVLAELAFPKQGRHSVGVQRQFSTALGRKAACQVGACLLSARPGFCRALAVRLYLPRAWREDAARLDAAGVPGPWRQPCGRGELARALLAGLNGEPVPERGLACAPSWSDEELTAAAAGQGLAMLPGVPAGLAGEVDACLEGLRGLGLDHFEGRSWRGFHRHASLVILASALDTAFE
jgi:SRSO17 transposase